MVNSLTRRREDAETRRNCSGRVPVSPCIAGQTVTEYILMLAILTTIGIWIFNRFAPHEGRSGAVKNMSQNAAEQIAKD